MRGKVEKAKNLDLEALNHALSFEIKNFRGKSFREYGYIPWGHGPSLNALRIIKVPRVEIF